MSQITLTKTRIRAGVWEGVLTGTPDPAVEVIHLERALSNVSLTAILGKENEYLVRVPIPSDALNDGVQTFVIRRPVTHDVLAHFTIITGVAMEDDLRAEVDLLRAELDMLKRAFRRHCLETMA